MKKNFIVLLCAAAVSINAQTPQNVTTNGNTLSSTEYIGTNNNQDLVIKTNGSTNTIFDKNGTVKMTSLQGTGNRILFGTPNGGVGAFSSGMAVTGDVTFDGNHSVTGSQLISGNHKVEGNQEVLGSLTSSQGIMFDANIGLKYLPAKPGGGREAFYLGSGDFEPLSSICPTPDPNYIWFATQGAYISRMAPGTTGAAPLVDASLTMMAAPWNGSGYIEIQGKDDHGDANNALFVNYFCGRNTYINANNALENHGGKVFMGERVSMAKSVGIGSNYPNENFEDQIALNVFANENNQTAIKLNSWNTSVKAIDLMVPGTSVSHYTLWQSGKVQIKSTATEALQILNPSTNFAAVNINNTGETFIGSSNTQPSLYVMPSFGGSSTGRVGIGNISPQAMLEIMNNSATSTCLRIQNTLPASTPTNVIDVYETGGGTPNFRVKSNGEVYGRKMKVTIGTFADYVFEKEYYKPTLEQVEQYITTEKHLPNVPSAKEIADNGADVGELITKNFEKTEELFLYVIEMNKRLNKLEEENKELKKQNELLLKSK